MVKKKVGTTVYNSVNSQLLSLLEHGVDDEKRELSSLLKEESALSKKLSQQEQSLKKNNVAEKRRKARYEITDLRKKLIQLKARISHANNSIKFSNEAQLCLNAEVQSKFDTQAAAQTHLREILSKLMKQKRESRERVVQHQRDISKEIKELSIKKNLASRVVDKELKEYDLVLKNLRDYKKVLVNQFNKLSSPAYLESQNFFKVSIKQMSKYFGKFDVSEINSLKSHHVNHQKNIKNISVLEAQIKVLEQSKKKLLEKIESETSNLPDMNYLRKVKGELEKSVTKKSKTLLNLRKELSKVKKFKADTVDELKSDKSLISQQQDSKEQLAADNVKKINDVKKVFKKELSALNRESDQVNSKLNSLQKQRDQLSKLAEMDGLKLIQVNEELRSLEASLQNRVKSESMNMHGLLNSIKFSSSEISVDKQRLSKLSALIAKAKKISVNSPEMAVSFKKQKDKLLSDISRLSKQVTSNKGKVKSIDKSLRQFKSSMSSRQRKILRHQSDIIVARDKHQKVLQKINAEFLSLHSTLYSLKQQESSLGNKNQDKLLKLELILNKKIKQIDSDIAESRNKYLNDSSRYSTLSNKMKFINTSGNKIINETSSRKKDLSGINKKINDTNHQQELLNAHKSELNKLLTKINRTNSFKMSLFNDLERDIRNISEKKLKDLVNNINAVSYKRKLLSQNLGKSLHGINTSLISKSKELKSVKSDVGKSSKLLKQQKLSVLRNKALRRVNILQSRINHLTSNMKRQDFNLSKRFDEFAAEKELDTLEFSGLKKVLSGERNLLREDKKHFIERASDASKRIRLLNLRVNMYSSKLKLLSKKEQALSERLKTYHKYGVDLDRVSKLKWLRTTEKDKLVDETRVIRRIMKRKLVKQRKAKQSKSKKSRVKKLTGKVKKSLVKKRAGKVKIRGKKKPKRRKLAIKKKLKMVKAVRAKLTKLRRKKSVKKVTKISKVAVRKSTKKSAGKVKVVVKKSAEKPVDKSVAVVIKKSGNKSKGKSTKKTVKRSRRKSVPKTVKVSTKKSSGVKESVKPKSSTSLDVKEFLLEVDQLLGKLPPDVIKDFANSQHFKLYQEILSQGGSDNKKDMVHLLKNIDGLLAKLPAEVITSFSKSDKFKLYKKIMSQYGVGK